ncbi:Hypothetical predicted protein [Paramuricea clavata]|uniref:Uncharacterized protein n=1 Tax=Paramuricea clavata TaxID=317549 RepID=A0A7D9HIR9_PARCT|nr:Hypothetical predicted protein [Paramuricea clavata]
MSKSAKSKNPAAKDKTTSKVGQELARDKERKRAIEFTCDSRSVSDGRGQLGREGVVGYIQSVSPPKQSRKNTEYSNFKLQAKSGLVPGVCFSSTKRSILAEREATKTAVKLDRFTYASDGKTIFVNDMTKISVPNSSDYDFQFVDSGIHQKDLQSIIKNSMDMDLVDFVAKVIAKDAVVQVVGSSQLRKVECFVADKSCKQAKLILWENDIEKVLVGNVYAFSNVRVRSDAVDVLGGEVTLNTTKDTTVVKQDGHALTNLVETLKENDLFNTSTSLKVPLIHAIEELNRFKQCCDCKKKIKQDSAKVAIKCDSCGHVVRSSMCQLNLCCKFSCQQNNSPDDKKLVRYIMFKDSIETLVGDITNLDDDKLCEKLLLLENFEITFNRDNVVSKCSLL